MSKTIPQIKIKEIQFHILNMHTRFPFQYGIASLTAIPHLFVKVTIEIDGKIQADGLTSEGLPPKWFTKNPQTRFEEDLPHFFDVIQLAANSAMQAPKGSYFDIWQHIQQCQDEQSFHPEISPLLANLGVALMERAIIDAMSRGLQTNLHQLLSQNLTGIHFDTIRPELNDIQLNQIIAASPRHRVHVRHTIGLGDPLDKEDTQGGVVVQDGLPYTLEENIQCYGLNYFKIKVRGNTEVDLARIRHIRNVVEHTGVQNPRFTLDGNESFQSLQQFKEFYTQCLSDADIANFFDKGLIFIEQPLHRSVALEEDLKAWSDRPPIVLDESDQSLQSLPKALDLGYQGCSHKNCKGIVKSLANAALIQVRNRNSPQDTYYLSGEDLANVGPIALNQDLAMVASLGIHHVERNGHHYFKGLSMFPKNSWDTIAEKALYKKHEEGFPTLQIQNGNLDLTSVNQAPFGTTSLLNSEQFTPLKEWNVESLGS